MRFLIVLAHDLAIVLETLAKRDHRSVRQEAEWILSQAIQQAAREQQDVLLDPEVSPALACEECCLPANLCTGHVARGDS